MDTHRAKTGCECLQSAGIRYLQTACIHVIMHKCVCIPTCMYGACFSTFYNLLMNTVSIHQPIERMVEIYTQLNIHLCKHKIPHSFDHCDCIVFRLYAKLLSTHGQNLTY